MSNKVEINRLVETTKSVNNKINNHKNSPLSTSISNNVLCMNQIDNLDMSTLDEKDKKLINEFVYLSEKSRQLFNGLRFAFFLES